MVFYESKELRSANSGGSKTALDNSPPKPQVRQQEMETDQGPWQDRRF
jgi:hypothetical protein